MNPSAPPDSAPTRLPWLAAGACAAALALLSGWLLRSSGRIGADGWFLTVRPAWPLSAWLLPLAALVLFGGLAASCLYDRFYRAKSPREAQTSLRLALGALMLLSVVWNWGMLGPYGFNARQPPQPRTGFFMLLASSWSDVATEYLGAAYSIESARGFSLGYASGWQRPRSAAVAHVATHPPGATLFYFACRRAVESVPVLREQLLGVSERATGLSRSGLASELNEMRSLSARSGGVAGQSAPLPEDAIATALLASSLLGAAPALAVPALFLLGSLGAAGASEESRRRAEGRGAVAAGLWILAPTVGLFAPTLDALVALGAVWSLALAAKSAVAPPQPGKSARKYLLASGGVLALTGFVSFGISTIGVALVLWLLTERRARDLAWLLAGALAIEAVLLLLFPHSLPLVFAQAMSAHRQATLSTRSYGTWLALNPVLFALFAGWPVVAGALRGLALKARTPQDSDPDPGLAHLKRLAMAALGAMLLISLAGSVRGEVERLWMFLAPPFCALAAASWLPISGGPRRSKVAVAGAVALLVIAMQAAQSLIMAATLSPLVTPF